MVNKIKNEVGLNLNYLNRYPIIKAKLPLINLLRDKLIFGMFIEKLKIPLDVGKNTNV